MRYINIFNYSYYIRLYSLINILINEYWQNSKNRVLSIEYIQDVVAKYFNISIEDLKGSRRSSDVVFPRQIAMYLCKNVAQISYPKIGQAFGKRDHSTIMHGYKKIEQEIKQNPESNTKLIVESVKKIILSKKG